MSISSSCGELHGRFFPRSSSSIRVETARGSYPSPLVPWKDAKWHVPARVKVLLLASEIVSEGLSAGTASAALSA